jgi:hypothetical protein
MPSWLIEDPTILYLVLAVIALVCLGLWWRDRKRRPLIGLAVVLVLVGLVALLDVFIVTERERLMTTLRTMAGRVQAVDVDGTFQHISDQFVLGKENKEQFRQFCRDAVQRHGISRMNMWDMTIVELSPERRTARVEFNAKAESSRHLAEFFRLVRADFVLDPDGQWRMSGFQLFDPFVNTSEPTPIPR